MVSMGASGIISVLGNALPRIFSDMVRLALQGKFEEARPLHFRLLEITRLLFTEGNPAGIKAALKHLKLCGDTVRLPLVNVSSATYDQIGQQLNLLK